MILKLLQWNIAGGQRRNNNDEPQIFDNYIVKDFQYFQDYIKKHNPDIVTFQESHTDKDKSNSLAKIASENLGYYYCNHDHADSHLNEKYRLSVSILSKYSLTDVNFTLFYNPMRRLTLSDGRVWITHDKGLLSGTIRVEDKDIVLHTLHMVPFRKYEIELNSDTAKRIFSDVEKSINIKSSYGIVAGDLNIDDKSLKAYFENVFKSGYKEIELFEPTTPKGRHYDHILYKGLNVENFTIDKTTLTDHYPLLVEFKL